MSISRPRRGAECRAAAPSATASKLLVRSLTELLRTTVILVAHPDDETIAFGGLIQRMAAPTIVFATDGAPADPYFWRAHGSREGYSAVREREALAAKAIADRGELWFLGRELGIWDQALLEHLPSAYEALVERMRRLRPNAVMTLAYEGGHPDHDCCSFLAHELGREIGIPVWEAPLYRRAPRGQQLVRQQFLANSGEELTVPLQAAEIERKRAMCAAYASQGDFLSSFSVDSELIRPQVTYDYSRPPHEGKLNYEMWGWAIAGEDVCRAVARFSAGVTRSRALAG